ncbi:hypothetical protein LTR28_001772 [Elasticomyces elasticus]|nr:hypothetical protein LTR28_001772 [Elasticomyces elasticus]
MQSGYAIVHALTTYPTPTTFSRIIGLTNRPLHRDVAQLPPDGRIEIYDGLNLLHREQVLMQLQAIPNIQSITHAYFCAYTGHGSDYASLRLLNSEILINAIGSLEVCCPALRFVTLQTGGKAYGVEFHDQVPYNPPLAESLPRIPEPYASNVFYYAQRDIIERAAAGKAWTFCEIRPDAVVGFVPQNNAMNIAQALALFLSLYRDTEGAGATVPFPGSADAWTAPHTDTSQDILARFHIFASMRPETVSRGTFNVADGPATTWQEVWPKICAYFGLVGGAPTAQGEPFDVGAWVRDRREDWTAWVQKHGLKSDALGNTDYDFMTAVMNIPFQRDYDLSASREVGFTEQRDHAEGYRRAFDLMRAARIIP